MSDADQHADKAIREAAYFIWEREGRPAGRALEHWRRAMTEAVGANLDGACMEDEEKVLAGRPDVNMPALLTKDVPGG